MTVVQPIPLRWFNTPNGLATCDLVIDRGPEADLEWVCVIASGPHLGEVWTYTNLDIRAVKNITLGRIPPTPQSLGGEKSGS